MRNRRVKGFTLVELIVVIAIIAVLAAILIPSMLGYVTKAKFSNANGAAKNLYNGAMIACRENDVIKPIPVGLYTGTAQPSGADGDTFRKYLYEYFAKAEGKDWATWVEGDCPVGAAFRKDAADPYVGTYPKDNNERKANVSIASAVDYSINGTW